MLSRERRERKRERETEEKEGREGGREGGREVPMFWKKKSSQAQSLRMRIPLRASDRRDIRVSFLREGVQENRQKARGEGK